MYTTQSICKSEQEKKKEDLILIKDLHMLKYFLGLSLFFIMACAPQVVHDEGLLEDVPFIPLPNSIESSNAFFELRKGRNIYIYKDDQKLKNIASSLSESIKNATSFVFNVQVGTATKKGDIFLTEPEVEFSDLEKYVILIDEKLTIIFSSSPEGFHNALQTLRQILPTQVTEDVALPTGRIEDQPSYAYRGSMLDISRHFFGVQDIKRYIDLISQYKINILHLHLTDDQGWRIEIKKWPKLTTVGSKTEVGGTPGGFLSQEDYKEVVAYAAQKYITIIPEIDMPGHTHAALVSYPELNCADLKKEFPVSELYSGTEVGFSSLCTSNEQTYEFIDDVIKELSDMTPGPFIHIGGDESDATEEDDYMRFVQKTEAIVHKYGKRAIGWDDIASAPLNASSIGQHWSKVENAKAAKEQNMQLIMSPAKKAYLDMKYTKETEIGYTWAGLIEIDTGYNWVPETYVDGIGKENIIGIEAPLWTETVRNMNELEYLAFPRLPGYAEIGWTNTDKRDWHHYKNRLGKHGPRFESLDINYYKSPLVPWVEK